MSATASADIRNIVLIGHKGSGKTTLAEAMLFVGKSTPKLGRVDDRSSLLDESPEEKERGTTLETSVAHLPWKGRRINVLDTPGESSFFAETRLAIAVADAAVLVVSAQHGVQPGHERVYGWARESGIPVLVAISKCDGENAKPDAVAAEVRARLKLPTTPLELCSVEGGQVVIGDLLARRAFTRPDGAGGAAGGEVPGPLAAALDEARGKLVDDVAGTDDELTEKYLTEGDLSQDELERGLVAAVRQGKLVPVLFVGSAAPAGISALLDRVVELVPPPTEHAPFAGRSAAQQKGTAEPPREERAPRPDAPLALYVVKTTIDPHAGRTCFARVLSGTLRKDAALLNTTNGNRERVGQFGPAVGREVTPADEAQVGDIVGLTKLKVTRSGDTLAEERNPWLIDPPELPPALFSRVVKFDAKGTEEKVATALSRLAEEDPGLRVGHDETTRDLVVAGLGTLHLEVAVERVKRRVGVEFRLGPPHIPYRETITRKVANVEGKQKKQTGGHGQFGVCYIDMEPLPRGSGFVFEDAIVGGAIPRQFIPSVEKGVVKAMSRGMLAGYPVVDLKIRLFDGKYHDVDSSDAAFQVAGRKAFMEAASKAGPVLLEPVVKLQVTVPTTSVGDVIGDLNSRRGRILGTDTLEDASVINAHVPLSEVLEYESKLKSMTQGMGTFTMAVEHMDIVPPMIQDKVIKESGFKAEVDED